MSTYICQQCGKEFEREPDKRENRCKFCCMPCYRASRKGSTPWNKGKAWSEETKEKMRQAKLENPTKYWLGKTRRKETVDKIINTFIQKWGFGNRKDYRSNWTKTLKLAIRQRDKFECKMCGKKEEDRALHVHHIDYDKKNPDPSNLITLCNSCHSKTNLTKRDHWAEKLRKVVASGEA